MPPLSPTETALPAEPTTQESQPAPHPPETGSQSSGNLILRNDTILGVCEAIGEDFGFNANWLRIPLAGGVLISPLASFGIYVALGLAVLASRLLFPAPRRPSLAHPAAEPHERTADNCEERLSAAA